MECVKCVNKGECRIKNMKEEELIHFISACIFHALTFIWHLLIVR